MAGAQKQTPLVRRLHAEMERCQINARELAAQADVGASFIYDILRGKSANPTTGKLSKVAQVLGVSLTYLLDAEPETYAAPLPADDLVAITIIDHESSSAPDALVPDISTPPYYFHKQWLQQQISSSPESLRLLFMHDNSMEPTLSQGDMMLIDTNLTSGDDGAIFVIFDNFNLLVRRISLDQNEGHTVITADNKASPLPPPNIEDNLEIAGKVVWLSRQIA